jgi:pSer/pThr/pTyr-binding forkhead associated (FHA) protein
MTGTEKFIVRYCQNGGTWEETPLTNEIVIGRSIDCDLHIDDGKTSRKHAHLSLKPDGLWLTDLGSSNGTYINDQRITPQTPHRIFTGQEFRIGSYTFSITEDTEEIFFQSPPTPEYILWYQQDDNPWQQFSLSGEVLIGRNPNCDLMVNDGRASRQHARLTIQPDGVWISDLGSSNGTTLENQRIPPDTPFLIYPGQIFSIGGFTFSLGLPDAQPALPEAPFPPPLSHQQPPRSKSKGRIGCLLAVFGGGGIISCLCLGAIGLYLMTDTNGPDFAATQQAVEATQLAWITQQPPTDPGLPGMTPVPPLTPAPDQPVVVPPDQPSGQQTWLVLLYQDADDEILERDILFDLNEAEFIGSSDRVQIVSQFDRYSGAYTGDGDWSSTRQYRLTTDGDLEAVHSQQLTDLGEANMGDPAVFVNFVTWAISSYPSDNYILIMSDHGSGWPGGFSDGDSMDDGILLNELDDALNYIVSQTGIGKFEIIGFDACLMAQIEVMTTLAPYAHFAVAAEETEPLLGWAYASFLGKLVNNPDMDSQTLAREIVNGYIHEDLRITDDNARVTWLTEIGDDPSAWSGADLAEYFIVDTTLSAIDLSRMPELNLALNELAYALAGADQASVAAAKTYSQSFDSAFGDSVPPSYIDLGHFSMVAKDETGNSYVQSAADKVLGILSQAVIAEKHGAERTGATGISIYFPNSELYSATYGNDFGLPYTSIAYRFSVESLWDDFLEYHYTGRVFEYK